MSRTEQMDAAAVLDDFTNRVANLPAEIQFLQDEIYAKEQQRADIVQTINAHDASIQRWIRNNGSHLPNPKEPAQRKEVTELYERAFKLDDDKVALSKKMCLLMDKHALYLDKQIEALELKGEMQPDPTTPSLLRPTVPERSISERPTIATLPHNPIGNSSRIAHSGLAHLVTQGHTPQRPAQLQQMGAAISLSTPVSPAAHLMAQKQRESSAGAPSKRPRLQGSLGTLPTASSGLARHSSLGPGTPKAGTPTGRAGSTGPRGLQKTGATSSKKVAPHKQSTTSRKAKKSGLSRVKRNGNKNSPSSTNDSELSDAESGSPDDDEERGSPRPAVKDNDGDDEMIDVDDDEAADDKKYCICASVSYGDMVACDNDNCKLEWFHWSCVGLKSEPEGTWICPVCTANGFKKS